MFQKTQFWHFKDKNHFFVEFIYIKMWQVNLKNSIFKFFVKFIYIKKWQVNLKNSIFHLKYVWSNIENF